jgi:pSer/pThr/pTyr-binding forkhead associated (FHA) protein
MRLRIRAGGRLLVHEPKEHQMSTLAPAAPKPHVISRSAPVVIGRQPDSDFVIDERTVSRRHAAIHREGYAWVLEDLGSMNGTRVNGKRVGRRSLVAPGDVIGFGAATARFDPDDRRLFSELEEPTGGT